MSYVTKYFSGLGFFFLIMLFMVLRPLSAGKEFMFFELFKGMFLSDIRLTLLFGGIIVWAQLEGFLSGRAKPEFLEILEDKAVFYLLNNKVYEFKYSELYALDRTKNIYKIFEFTFKDGRKQTISDAIKNSELAFEIIRKKIQENR